MLPSLISLRPITMQFPDKLLDGARHLCKAPRFSTRKVQTAGETVLESRASVSCLTPSDNKITIRQRFSDCLAASEYVHCFCFKTLPQDACLLIKKAHVSLHRLNHKHWLFPHTPATKPFFSQLQCQYWSCCFEKKGSFKQLLPIADPCRGFQEHVLVSCASYPL